jgi:hypothetical protein
MRMGDFLSAKSGKQKLWNSISELLNQKRLDISYKSARKPLTRRVRM